MDAWNRSFFMEQSASELRNWFSSSKSFFRSQQVTYIRADVGRLVGRSVGLQNILKNFKMRFRDYCGGCDLFLP